MTITDRDFLALNAQIQFLDAERKSVGRKMHEAITVGREAGMDERARRDALRLSRLSHEARIEYLNHLIGYLKTMRVRGHDTLHLVQIPDPTREENQSDWFCDGFAAAAAGLPRSSCPHDARTPSGLYWNQGFDACLAEKVGGEPPPEKKKKKSEPKRAQRTISELIEAAEVEEIPQPVPAAEVLAAEAAETEALVKDEIPEEDDEPPPPPPNGPSPEVAAQDLKQRLQQKARERQRGLA